MAKENNQYLKYSSLVVLTLQNAVFVLISRYSKSDPNSTYITSVMVFITEISKLLISLLCLFIEQKSVQNTINMVIKYVINDPYLTLKISLPSFLYVIQNNLIFLAVSNLEAPTFQVCYQLKILTTAGFSFLMLNKKLSIKQIIALIILFVGVSTVSVGLTTTSKKDTKSNENPLVGIVAVILGSLTSGFAGVYSEKCLKQLNISVWILNIQMASTGFILAFITSLFYDYSTIMEHGFLLNFGYIAWVVVLFQAFGGLLVSIVMKYADNILKGYATSCAIILSTILSVFIFNSVLNTSFIIGASMVITSTILYSYALRSEILPK